MDILEADQNVLWQGEYKTSQDHDLCFLKALDRKNANKWSSRMTALNGTHERLGELHGTELHMLIQQWCHERLQSLACVSLTGNVRYCLHHISLPVRGILLPLCSAVVGRRKRHTISLILHA